MDAWEDLDSPNYMDWCMSNCKFWHAYCFQGIMKGLKLKSCGYWGINWFAFTNLLWKIVIHNCPFVQNGNICPMWLNSPKVKMPFGPTYYHYKESCAFQSMSLQLVSKPTIFRCECPLWHLFKTTYNHINNYKMICNCISNLDLWLILN